MTITTRQDSEELLNVSTEIISETRHVGKNVLGLYDPDGEK